MIAPSSGRPSPLATSTLAQVGRLLRHLTSSLLGHPDLATRIPPLFIWGPPGVGKSAMVKEVAQDLGIGFIDIRLAQREPVDIKGLPVPGPDGLRWLVASDWPRDAASKGIILFDELTACDRSIQVAAYEMLLDRRLGDTYRLPDGWYLCAAGNRHSDRAAAVAMSSALANRFCHIEVAADIESWGRWAVETGIHADVLAFLRFQPERLFAMTGDTERGWPSPRAWERTSVALDLARDGNLAAEDLNCLIAGLVGQGTAAEFIAFRRIMAELPEVSSMLARQTPVLIPERADQRHALCSAAAWHTLRPQAWRAVLEGLVDLVLQLPVDFATMLLTDVMISRNAETEFIAALANHPRLKTWRQRNGKNMQEAANFHRPAIVPIGPMTAKGHADTVVRNAR